MESTTEKVDAIEQHLNNYQRDGKRLLVTSSFQTHSIPMLHILQQLQPGIAIAFLDTGYHFEETLAFKNAVAKQLSLNVGVISGNEKPKASGLYISSPTSCCETNKIALYIAYSGTSTSGLAACAPIKPRTAAPFNR